MAVYPVEDRIPMMSEQYFNKRESLVIPSEYDGNSKPVDKSVLAGMLANFESLGYRFGNEDILKMAMMPEDTLTKCVYDPAIKAMRRAKGADVEHNILFKGFPDSVRALDIDTLSSYRFMSYFTVLYDEYLEGENAFAPGSLTSELQGDIVRLAEEKAAQKTDEAPYAGDGQDVLNAIRRNILKGDWIQENKPRRTKTGEKEENKEKELITVHLDTPDGYYKMVNNMLSGKTSLSEYDRGIVEFALDNCPRERFMPETIPFKETWALTALHDFKAGNFDSIDIKTIPDFERLVAALTPGADISLEKKQKYRNFTNRERKDLYRVFSIALKKNYPLMLESALKKNSKLFIKNVLRGRLHFQDMKGGRDFADFIERADNTRSKMSLYEAALNDGRYADAAKALSSVSPGVLLDHTRHLITSAEKNGKFEEAAQIISEISMRCRTAPMDKLLALKQIIDSNISKEDDPLKFRLRGSKNVAVEPFANTSEKMGAQTKEYMSWVLEDIIREQLSAKDNIGKVYIDPALKNCPIPVAGRADSGRNRTVAMGTKLPVCKDSDVLRAALYKKGQKNGFFDFSVAFLDKNYMLVKQVSWNNLKEGFAYHSGDCADTRRGVTEIIDVDLSKVKRECPQAKYVVYEGMAWNSFTTVNELDQCFLTLSEVNHVGEGKPSSNNMKDPLDPKDVKFRVDLTGDSFANIPVLYDLESREISVLNLPTFHNINDFASPDINRHFDLPKGCEAIENYSGELALTAYYINERLMLDKPNLYDLAMLNVEARGGELVENMEDADVIFSTDRGEAKEGQKLVSVYDKDIITTEYIVPKVEKAAGEKKDTVRSNADLEAGEQPVYETDNVRVFITDGPFTAGSHYSSEKDKTIPATVTLNAETGRITVAFADGKTADKSAKEVAQELWGQHACGRCSIAGSPYGEKMSAKDLVSAAIKVEEAAMPPISMDRVEELRETRSRLSDAINKDIRTRGLDIDAGTKSQNGKEVCG